VVQVRQRRLGLLDRSEPLRDRNLLRLERPAQLTERRQAAGREARFHHSFG
jgi:hypothetical protein